MISPRARAALVPLAAAVLASALGWAAYRAVAPSPPAPRPSASAPAAPARFGVREAFSFPGEARIAALALDPEGNVVLAASLSGTIDLGGGPLVSAGHDDVVVAKLDPRGKHLWSKRFGGPGYQVPHAIAIDPRGRIVVAGTLDQTTDFGKGPLTSAGLIDVFVLALDPSGQTLWSRRFGDAAEQEASAVGVDAEGAVYVAGSYEGALDFGGGALPSAGADDIYLAKLEASGAHVWSKRFGDARHQKARALAVDAQGGLALVGTNVGTVDFGGGPLVAGEAQELILARFDAAGRHLTSKRFPGATAGRADPRAVVVGAPGILIAGGVRGGMEVGIPFAPVGDEEGFVLAFGADERPLFGRRFGGAGSVEAKAAARLAGGGVVVVGRFDGEADFGGKHPPSGGRGAAFVAALDPGGAVTDVLRFPGDARQLASTLAVGRDGSVWVGMEAQGRVDLGRGPVAGPGIHVLRMAGL